MGKQTRIARAFGRRYIVSWDAAAGRFRVALGAENIGSHVSHDGAVAIATAHARCTALPQRQPPYVIETVGGADRESAGG